MNKLKHIWSSFKYALLLIGLAIIIGFTNARHAVSRISDVSITVDNQFENYFIDQDDVLSLMNEEGKDYLLNSNHASLNLKEVETRIENHPFVQNVQAYIDLEGNLSIEVEQNRPIARVVSQEGMDYYISTEGDILPESPHYTARVPLIQLEDENWLPEYSIHDAKEGEKIFELLKTIVEDDFWSAQIAGILIKKNLEVNLYPQVTKQVVELGKAEDVAFKLRKLKTFYKQILPYKGWNAYDTVNLKFRNQIVCKK